MTVEELEAALEYFNPLILNILDSGVPLYDDGTFDKLDEHFKQTVPTQIAKRAYHWKVVA